MKIEQVYKRFTIRLKRPLMISFFISCLCLSLVYCIFESEAQDKLRDKRILLVVIETIAILILSIMVCIEEVFNRITICLSTIFWIILFACKQSIFSLQLCRSPTDDLMPTFLLIFATHLLLPFPKRLSTFLSFVSTLGHLIASALHSNIRLQHLTLQLTCNGLLLLSVNCIGVYHKYIQDSSLRKTFVNTRRSIESRIKLEHERRQQESLLLSVLPAQIAADLMDKMLSQLQNTGNEQRRLGRAYARFHAHHFRLHENVRFVIFVRHRERWIDYSYYIYFIAFFTRISLILRL